MNLFNDQKKLFYFFAFSVLAILSLFILKNNLNNKMFTSEQVNSEIVSIQTQSQSDELDEIKKDLENTNLEDIDKELDAIEKELDSAI